MDTMPQAPPEEVAGRPPGGEQPPRAPEPPVWTPVPPPGPYGGWGGPYGPYGAPGGQPWPPQPPKKRSATAVAVVVAMAVSSLVGFGLAARLRPSQGSPIVGTSAQGGSDTATGSGPSDAQAAAVAAKVNPGIVDVNTVLGFQNGAAAGTGMVLSSSGEVLTNNHVVDGATAIRVTLVSNGRTYAARVVGTDPVDDVAVLQLQGASGLKTVTTGSSSGLSLGTPVIAIGNALGQGGTPSVVRGSITSLDQTITAGDASGGNAEQLSGLIETDAALQPGDSGGPLVTTDGKVVGIDTAASASFRFQAAGGVSFAIPINTALAVAKQIESGKAPTGGRIGTAGFLGVQVDATQTGGAVIRGVERGTPAASAGMSAGDTITSVDGTSIDSASALTSILAGHKPGDRVTIGWVDVAGQSHTAPVTLATAPVN